MTPLKEIEAWCYKQIELMNRMYDIKDFPGEVEFCGYHTRKTTIRAMFKRIHIFIGIERISAALKVPVHIDIYDSDVYKKSVTHLGVEFYQIEWFADE